VKLARRLAAVSPLERRLRAWGYAYGVREPAQGEPGGESPLARLVVDRTREGDLEDDGWRPVPRSNATLKRLRALLPACRVPAWAGGDPVPVPRSKTGKAPGKPFPRDAEEVEREVLCLLRFDREAGLALRARYCLIGRRPWSERVDWCVWWGGRRMSRHQYLAAVARGRAWVGKRLALEDA